MIAEEAACKDRCSGKEIAAAVMHITTHMNCKRLTAAGDVLWVAGMYNREASALCR